MAGTMKMFLGMASGRLVATTDVSAFLADSEVKPVLAAHRDADVTAGGQRSHWLNVVEMSTDPIVLED